MAGYRRALGAVAAAALVLAQSGCTFFYCKGGEPLSRAELGDWAGIPAKPAPEAEAIAARTAEFIRTGVHDPISGTYSWAEGPDTAASLHFGHALQAPFTPARGLHIRGSFQPWPRLQPGRHRGEWYYFSPLKKKESRSFYAVEEERNYVLFWKEQVDAYDVASRERVAARKVSASELLPFWMRLRRIRPVDAEGEPGLHALADPNVALRDSRYDVRDGSILFAGIVGWGRVNRKPYAQLFWIPVPLDWLLR